MKIVCIAWDSLIWEPGPLKLASSWQPDGPSLPLEFVRDSDDIDHAREMLRQREKIRPALPQ